MQNFMRTLWLFVAGAALVFGVWHGLQQVAVYGLCVAWRVTLRDYCQST